MEYATDRLLAENAEGVWVEYMWQSLWQAGKRYMVNIDIILDL